MSRRNPSNADLLLMAPWWVSAALAVIIYVGLRWVWPAIGSEDALLRHMIPAAAHWAWFPAVLLLVTAGASAFMAKKKRALVDTQTDLASIRELDWQKFEWMVGEAYRRRGYEVEESIAGGADGGIDLTVRKDGETWLVQCKQWKTQSVGVTVVREMFGLMAHHRASGATIITSGRFTREAASFAEGKPLQLIDGPALAELIKAVQVPTGREQVVARPAPAVSPARVISPAAPAPAQPHAMAKVAPSCPLCGAVMIERTAKKGANAGNKFWGCSTYPKCRGVRER